MFTDFLTDSQLRNLRLSEKDDRYTSWPVEFKSAQDGSQPEAKIFRCWRCGRDLVDFEEMSLSLKELAAITKPHRWIELFPDLEIVKLKCRGHDGDHDLPIFVCPLCVDPILENEDPQRLGFVLASLWGQWLEDMGAEKGIIVAKMKEIGNLEIEGSSE